MYRKTCWRLAVTLTAFFGVGANVGGVTAAESSSEVSSESIVAEMETVGGHIKITQRTVTDDLPLRTIYLNGVQVYKANVWGLLPETKFKIGAVDVIPINFLSGANVECIDSYGIFAVRPDKTAYWIKKAISYCNATFAVVGDTLVMTDTIAEGRRSKTEKTIISLDGTISHAR